MPAVDYEELDAIIVGVFNLSGISQMGELNEVLDSRFLVYLLRYRAALPIEYVVVRNLGTSLLHLPTEYHVDQKYSSCWKGDYRAAIGLMRVLILAPLASGFSASQETPGGCYTMLP